MTKQIKSITSNNIKDITGDILEALKAVEEKYGIEIARKGNISYSSDNFTMKLDVAVVDEDGVNQKEEKNFLMFAQNNGISPDGFNKTINLKGTDYLVVGANPRAYKMPIKAIRIKDGEQFKFALDIYERNFPLVK